MSLDRLWAEKHSAPMLVRITKFNGKYYVTGYVQQPARSHTVRLPDEPEREWCTGGGLGKRTGGCLALVNAVSWFRDGRHDPSWQARLYEIEDR